MTFATKLSENPKIKADKDKPPRVTDFCVIRPSLCGLKKRKTTGGEEGSFDGPQNSQLSFTGKYAGPIQEPQLRLRRFCCLQ